MKKNVYERLTHSTRRVARKIKRNIRKVQRQKRKALAVAVVFSLIGIIIIGILILVQIDTILNLNIFNVESAPSKSDDEIARTCNVDQDCVPDSCCHAFRCVNTKYAPRCADTFCSANCQPGTMDCGQGYCACTAGLCEAYILNP